MRPRSVGRRLALQYLFMADLRRFGGIEPPESFFQTQREAERDARLDAAARHGDADAAEAPDQDDGFAFDDPDDRQDEAEEFALGLISAVNADRERIDWDIGKAADNWTVARIGAIERNVLRLAAAELAVGGTPRKVVMDEAVKLAKRFGGKDSGAFVNGVVDRMAKG